MASFTYFSFFFFFILLLVLTFQTSTTKATYSSYHDSTKCSHGGPSIHYPFHIKGSLPGFELLCKENLTTIHFPSYGDLVVKSISYDTKKIQLLDPKNCVHGVFLNLNLSSTPFQYYHVLKNYTYLNCSTKLSTPSFTEVPCLSAAGSHVYTVDPELHVPGSCNGFKTVAIPFEYSPYISDNSLGLALTWNLPHSEERKDKAISKTTDSHTTRYTVLGLSICSLAVAIALMMISIIKVTGSTWNCSEKEDPLLQSLPNV
ncbi:putative RING-H2 finger protein ATL21B [Arachis ipaensis]|uniref:putative RING-H2 finger protein ATL21B n=1 Tax=Arachis ipaensis TaxID=130454 RepID=UPI0007AF9243|nr:putative RING-H2 finger protein ATL21B [Arachis ipaensis]